MTATSQKIDRTNQINAYIKVNNPVKLHQIAKAFPQFTTGQIQNSITDLINQSKLYSQFSSTKQGRVYSLEPLEDLNANSMILKTLEEEGEMKLDELKAELLGFTDSQIRNGLGYLRKIGKIKSYTDKHLKSRYKTFYSINGNKEG